MGRNIKKSWNNRTTQFSFSNGCVRWGIEKEKKKELKRSTHWLGGFCKGSCLRPIMGMGQLVEGLLLKKFVTGGVGFALGGEWECERALFLLCFLMLQGEGRRFFGEVKRKKETNRNTKTHRFLYKKIRCFLKFSLKKTSQTGLGHQNRSIRVN